MMGWRRGRRVAITAAMAALAGCWPATSALGTGGSSTTADPAELVLDQPAPGTIYEDTPTHLSGRLSSQRESRLVVIQQRGSNGWQPVARTRTDDVGEFALDFAPAEPGPLDLRAVHPSPQHRSVSATQPLEVLDRRVFVAARSTYETFDDIVLVGTVRPRTAHQYVALQRLVDDRWLPVHAGYTDSDGRFAISMPDNRPGIWTVRAYWPGERPSGGTREYSHPHRYTVLATLDPVVTRVTRDQLGGSYHDGCPVGPASLRNLAMTFHTFGPFVGRGTLVVRSTIVDQMTQVFAQALSDGYPIRRMLPTAYYGGSDVRSMNHDNTSAFNCRHVTGDPTHLSPHSYGTAIDIDTVENPYLDVTGTWWPKNTGQQYRDRSQAHPGMLYADSRVTRDLNARGFRWGGRWYHPDYQHFDPGSGKIEGRVPARTAGPLTAATMPPASAVGAGWTRFARPVSTEAGYSGNGSFVQARRGRGAAVGVLPMGCATPYSQPVATPSYALQGSYLSTDRRQAQAVEMQFSTVSEAEAFFTQLRSTLQACVAADGSGGMVVRGFVGSASSYRAERWYDSGERWRERDQQRGRRITVLLVEVSGSS